MSLKLHDVRRLALEVVHAQDEALEVLGVVTPSRGSGYTEVIIGRRGDAADESLILVGLDRETSEEAFRTSLAGKLRAQAEAEEAQPAVPHFPLVRAVGRP